MAVGLLFVCCSDWSARVRERSLSVPQNHRHLSEVRTKLPWQSWGSTDHTSSCSLLKHKGVAAWVSRRRAKPWIFTQLEPQRFLLREVISKSHSDENRGIILGVFLICVLHIVNCFCLAYPWQQIHKSKERFIWEGTHSISGKGVQMIHTQII